MKRISRSPTHHIRLLLLLALALGASLAAAVWLGSQPVHALPEYATRTGEPCATCHVSPGGGGPRTLRGLLWGARGKPDQVPALPGVLIAPGVGDGAELYDIACAACHGSKGEGLFATGLAGIGVGERSIRSFVRRGIPRGGMPAFEGQFTGEQLDALVSFVAGLASRSIEPLPDRYSLPPAQLECGPRVASPSAAPCAPRERSRRSGGN